MIPALRAESRAASSPPRRAGLSDRQLATRVRSGTLTKPGPNVFRYPGVPSSPPGELMAAVLDVGSPVWVAGHSAAAAWGFDGFALSRPFHLLVPGHRCVRRDGVHVHRSDDTEPIDVTRRHGLPITTPERTVIDLARKFWPNRLLAAIDSGIRDRVLDENVLHRRIVALRSQGKHGIPALIDVIEQREMTRGGESWLEREYLRLVAEAGLPRL